MTMANATSSTPHRPSPSASLRKTNKPLMEKRRRARINDSLGQLKSLVIQSSKKDSSQFNKLEKADILEMTVKHLRTLQTQQQTQQQQLSQASDPNSNTKYTAGFMECANEVMRFLKQSSGFSDEIKTRVVGHLANCLHQAQAQTYPRAPASAAIVNQSGPGPRLNPAPTTTAQLSNGQIIQIVNTPFQQQQPPVTVQQSAAPPAVLVATSLPTVSQSVVSSQTSMLTSAASAQPQRSLAQEPVQHESNTSYSRYCQPLHIHIPTTESPVLAKQIPQHAAIPVVRSEERVPVTMHQSRAAPLSPRSNTSLSMSSSSSPSPVEKDISPAPRSSAFKHLDFYANDNYSDYHARSRTFSSASSNESEMMSPLNLSQSPPYDNQKEYSHPIVKPVKVETYPTEKPANPRDFESHSFTSVIVNHKKSLDIPSAKYMRMMEEERQCVRSQGTPSPASSMGETAVWRPW